MKYCENCGQKVSEDAKFCSNCGHLLENMDAESKQDESNKNSERNQNERTEYMANGQTYTYTEDDKGNVFVTVGDKIGQKERNILRLVAFIFALVGTIGEGFLIIPLAWCIPMTMTIYSYYMGRKDISLAFAICTLIFVSPVAGVILIVEKHI